MKIVRRSEKQSGFDQAFCELQSQARLEPYRANVMPKEYWSLFLNASLPEKKEFFIAYNESGTAAARAGANVSAADPKRGHIGFFEMLPGKPAEGAAVVNAALSWLKNAGCTQAVGPIDFSTWFTYRFSTKLDGEAPFSWEPLCPPEYPALFESCGFKAIEHFHSSGFLPNQASLDHVKDLSAKAGILVVPFKPDYKALHELSMRVFAGASLFEPIPLELFSSLYTAGLSRFDASPSRMAYSSDGRLIGFLFAFIDRDTLILKTIAVDEAFRNSRLSTLLLAEAFQASKLKRVVSALIRTGSGSEHHERRQDSFGTTTWRHEYALYGKTL